MRSYTEQSRLRLAPTILDQAVTRIIFVRVPDAEAVAAGLAALDALGVVK